VNKIASMSHYHTMNHNSFSVGVPILTYHQIVGNKSLSLKQSAYLMPVSQFERQMRYLHDSRYRCISLKEVLHDQPYRFTPAEKAFVLTFDDGYENFLTNAYPILHRYGFTATVFLVAGHIGKTNSWDGQWNTRLLTRKQIAELYNAGISFGSHTSSHPHLPNLSREQIIEELAGSKKHLESTLRQKILFLAYPYGESNHLIRDLAKQAGYMAACGVVTGKSGRYNLWRRPCESQDNHLMFRFKLTPGYYRLLQLLRWFREDNIAGLYLREIKHHRSFHDRN